MKLKNTNFDHSEENFNKALGIPTELRNLCRERIFFTHFTHSLQADEMFPSRDDAPKEFKTVTGDLQTTLQMITDPLEYEFTLLHFMPYQRMAQEAYARYLQANKPPDEDDEEDIKHQLLKLVSKLHELKHKMDEDDDNDEEDEDENGEDLTVKKLIARVDSVKKSRYNFFKYMELIGQPINRNFGDVDDMINGIFK